MKDIKLVMFFIKMLLLLYSGGIHFMDSNFQAYAPLFKDLTSADKASERSRKYNLMVTPYGHTCM